MTPIITKTTLNKPQAGSLLALLKGMQALLGSSNILISTHFSTSVAEFPCEIQCHPYRQHDIARFDRRSWGQAHPYNYSYVLDPNRTFLQAANHAVATPTEYQTAGDHGFRTLWVVFVIMVVTSIIFAAVSWKVPVSRRLYHIITTLITIITALSYFAMASGHATAYNCITVKDHHGHKIPDTHHDVCRQVFWGRYVGWSLTGPLLLADLCLLAGIDGAHTLLAVVANLITVLSGLFAAFGREHSVQKWGWYAIGCIAYLFVVWHLVVHGTKAVKSKGDKARKLFGSLAAFSLVLWTVYPM